jgi:YgiT-type zinc finger domain-containing protein
MKQVIYEESLSRGGESIELSNMSGASSPQCGEVVWDEDSYDRYFKAQDALVIKARNRAKERTSPHCVDDDQAQVRTTS